MAKKSNSSIKHNASYLDNNLNRIKNVMSGNKIKNINLATTNSKYMECEKNGMNDFINASIMLNTKVVQDLTAMAKLKDNYTSLEHKLRFGVDLKSELLDQTTVNLSLLAANSQFIKQYEKDHPYINGGTYSKEDAQKLYGKYFNDPNIKGFFDVFYNSTNGSYTVPDIVFNKYTEGSGRRATDRYEIVIDAREFDEKAIIKRFMDTINSLDPKLAETVPGWQQDAVKTWNKTLFDSFESKISYSSKDGYLTIDLTEFMKHLNNLDNAANAWWGRGSATDEQREMVAQAIEGLEDFFKK